MIPIILLKQCDFLHLILFTLVVFFLNSSADASQIRNLNMSLSDQEIYKNFASNRLNASDFKEDESYWWLNESKSISPTQGNDLTDNYSLEYKFFYSLGQWSNTSHLLQPLDSYLYSSYGLTLAAYGNDLSMN